MGTTADNEGVGVRYSNNFAPGQQSHIFDGPIRPRLCGQSGPTGAYGASRRTWDHGSRTGTMHTPWSGCVAMKRVARRTQCSPWPRQPFRPGQAIRVAASIDLTKQRKRHGHAPDQDRMPIQSGFDQSVPPVRIHSQASGGGQWHMCLHGHWGQPSTSSTVTTQGWSETCQTGPTDSDGLALFGVLSFPSLVVLTSILAIKMSWGVRAQDTQSPSQCLLLLSRSL